nr:translation initiation factor IF-2-like [Pongo abelii]
MGAPRPACTKPRPRVPASPPPPRAAARGPSSSPPPAAAASAASSGREERDESARAPAEPRLSAPGEGKHAPTHAPLRAPKITRAGRAPTPGQPAPTSGAPGTHPEVTGRPRQGLGARSPAAQSNWGRSTRHAGKGAHLRRRARGSGGRPDTVWTRGGGSRGSPGPGRAGGDARVSPDPNSPEAAACRALSRPLRAPLKSAAPRGNARRAGAAGYDNRCAAPGQLPEGAAQTHPTRRLLSPPELGAAPYRPRGPSSVAPDPPRAAQLPVEIAAVAAAVTEAGSSGRGDLKAEWTGAPNHCLSFASPELRQLSVTRPEPRGATTAQASGPGTRVPGLRISAAAPHSCPSPAHGTRFLPTQFGTLLSDFPSGSDPFNTLGPIPYPWAPD